MLTRRISGSRNGFTGIMWRRVTRIYPIYWVVTVIQAIRAFFSADFAIRLAPSHIIHSLLLLPETTEPLVGVGWTLRSEMLFYLVFALAILDRRLCKPLIVIALMLVAIGLVVSPADPWAGLLVSGFNIQFLMGIAAARFLAQRSAPNPIALIAGGILFFLAAGGMEIHGVVPLNGLIGRVLYGGASMAILLGLVEAERAGTIRFGLCRRHAGKCLLRTLSHPSDGHPTGDSRPCPLWGPGCYAGRHHRGRVDVALPLRCNRRA